MSPLVAELVADRQRKTNIYIYRVNNILVNNIAGIDSHSYFPSKILCNSFKNWMRNCLSKFQWWFGEYYNNFVRYVQSNDL